MALTVNWLTKVVYSDLSITDLPAHHIALRDLEASESGILYDDICSWQSLSLGNGATLPQIDYINGYILEFTGPGPFQIDGNLNCTIADNGLHIERKTSAAYITTVVGATGPTPSDIAAAVRTELAVELARLDIALTAVKNGVNVSSINNVTLKGSGTTANPWDVV